MGMPWKLATFSVSGVCQSEGGLRPERLISSLGAWLGGSGWAQNLLLLLFCCSCFLFDAGWVGGSGWGGSRGAWFGLSFV